MPDDFDWLQLLRMGASLYGGVSGGFGAGTGGLGLPDAGAASAAATGAAMPPVSPIPPDITMPAGTTLPPPAVRPIAPPAALPTPPIPPAAAPAALPPPSATPPPDPIKPFWNENNPIGTENTRTWWQRNVSDPTDKAWDKAWKDDPNGLSPGMKALGGIGSMAGKLGAAPAAAAPAVGAGGGGGAGAGGYKPSGAINASQMALTREQARQLLLQRATLNAPWLKQRLQAGLMG